MSYKSGTETYEVNAVLGRTKYEITDDYGLKIAAFSVDFLVSSSELPVKPKVGDQIVTKNVTFEVLELGGECWRWCDPHGVTKRIHAKAIDVRL